MTTATLPASQPMAPPTIAGQIQNDMGAAESLYEVVDGQRLELPSMGIRSIWLSSRLFKHLVNHVDDHRLGTVVSEGLFILDTHSDLRRRPDLAFVSAHSWPLDRPMPMEGDWNIVPDLAVEVISPNDLFEDVLAKIDEYFDHGAKQIWIISPATEKVYIYANALRVAVLSVSDELNNCELLPGFSLEIAKLFGNEAART